MTVCAKFKSFKLEKESRSGKNYTEILVADDSVADVAVCDFPITDKTTNELSFRKSRILF